MTVHIVTGSNAAYMEKMRPYLETLKTHAGAARCWLCCVDCAAPEWLPENIAAVYIPRDALAGSPPETESLQSGGWLPYLPIEDSDTVIFTDGDIFMQRGFSDNELMALEQWPENAIGASFNAGPTETLLHEALYKLHPQIEAGAFLTRWGLTALETCLNVGVLVARRATFARLHDSYMGRWAEIGLHMTHPARQQWLIGYTAYHDGFDVRILPYEFHLHAHFALPPGALVGRAGDAYINGNAVLFWHVPMRARRHV